MKREAKKYLWLLFILLLITFFPAIKTSAAENGTCGDSITWELNDNGTLTINGAGAMSDYSYSSDSPFKNNENIQRVIISDGITTVGDNVFESCVNLSDIQLPPSLTKIGDNAFRDCKKLQKVILSDNVTRLGSFAFYGCDNLKDVTLGKNITELPYWVFGWCTSLEKIKIPEGVTSIDGAFAYCDLLKEINIPDGLTYIGPHSFANTDLTAFHIPQGVTEIKERAFYGMDELLEITIPEGVTSIEDEAFADCYELRSITLPDKLESIGENAFLWCVNLRTLTIPEHVKTIGNLAFQCCKNINELVIPGSVESMGWGCFCNCNDSCTHVDMKGRETKSTGLKKVVLNEGIVTIGPGAFEDDYRVSEIFLPKSLKNIDVNAFSGCSGLKEVYYSGTEKEWNSMNIGEGNENLTNANIHFDMSINHESGEYTHTATNYNTEYTGAFSFRSDVPQKNLNRTLDNMVTYKDSFFSGDARNYDHRIAKLSICTAMAAFNKASGKYYLFDIPEDLNLNQQLQSKAGNVIKLWKDCGFDRETMYINEGYMNPPDSNTVGVAIAQKPIGEETLIAVAIRGGAYEKEWAGNFNVFNSGTNHNGFQRGANQAEIDLLNYIKNKQITGSIKFWIVGYSRGAAIANLLAAKLNELSSQISVVTYSNKDVFAYTFETPQNTKDKNHAKAKYENIINIINPIDPVPKVAMRDWGYARYGKNYYLPTEETHSDYLKLAAEALNRYIVASGKNHPYLPHIAAQSYVFDKAFSGVAFALGNDSTQRTQVASYEVQNIILDSYKQNKCTDFEMIKSAFGYLINHYIGRDITILKYLLVDLPFQSHYAEMTLAWVYSVDNYFLDTDGEYRLFKVNCPVDVKVYNALGELVAKIENDESVEIEGQSIQTYIDEDDQKIIILPADAEYSVSVTAREDADVSCSISDYSIENACETDVKTYYDIDMKKGESIQAKVEEKTDAPSKTIVTDSEENIITPDEEYDKDHIVRCQVLLKSDGDGKVFGECNKTKGEFVKVKAVPNEGESFLGWYEGDTLVSITEDYRFCVKNTTTLTGKFTVHKKETLEVSSLQVSGISNKIAAGRSIQLNTIILPANAANKKLFWSSSDTKIATVSQTGKVSISKSAGGKSVTIKAETTDGSGKSVTYKINVMKAAVKSIKIKGIKKTLKAGKTMKLKAVVKTTKGKSVNKKIKWSSSNTKYATITSSGKVKALKEGKGKKVTITASATDGTGKKKKAVFRIKCKR